MVQGGDHFVPLRHLRKQHFAIMRRIAELLRQRSSRRLFDSCLRDRRVLSPTPYTSPVCVDSQRCGKQNRRRKRKPNRIPMLAQPRLPIPFGKVAYAHGRWVDRLGLCLVALARKPLSERGLCRLNRPCFCFAGVLFICFRSKKRQADRGGCPKLLERLPASGADR